MPIVSSELLAYRSSAVNDLPSNGGIMSSSLVISGVSSNLFPNASAADRASGGTKYRKMFFKVANASNLTLVNPRIWMDSNTVGDDRITFFAGTQRDVMSAITGAEPLYGMGLLGVGVSAGASSLDVQVEHGATVIFRNGDTVRISNRPDPHQAGDEFWTTIDQVPSVSGNIVTIHLAAPVPVGFLAGVTKVSSVLTPADIQPEAVSAVASSAAGYLDGAWQNYLTPSSIGSIEQNWTLTFTSAVAFDISGDTLGSIGAGNRTTTTAPSNMSVGAPYFTIDASFFAGTWTAGDTVTFTTHPAATPIWLRRVIPAGSAAQSNNNFSLYIDGETA